MSATLSAPSATRAQLAPALPVVAQGLGQHSTGGADMADGTARKREPAHSPDAPNPSGLCQCGCGQLTPIAKSTRPNRGWVKGEHVRFMPGHGRWANRALPEGPNPSGLCTCGCGQPAPIAKETNPGRGRIMGRPLRYIRGHNSRAARDLADISSCYTVDPETGCWIWSHSVNRPGGYGEATLVGVGKSGAHRLMYESHKGPIPEGFVVHHTCGNPSCVNPDHLEAMSHRDHQRLHATARKVKALELGRFELGGIYDGE